VNISETIHFLQAQTISSENGAQYTGMTENWETDHKLGVAD
jgi:hypothetical protein